MEALVAVGLASNVLQFVDFTAKLIGISNELRNNAASSENRDHKVIATHLETLSQNISDSAKAISQTSATASPEEKALQPVADKCRELSKILLERLNKCGIQAGQNDSRFHRAKGAIKAIWNKREIEEISSRLEYFRSELILHFAFQTRKTQLDNQGRQPSRDDIQAVLDKLDDLGPVIKSAKRDINDKSNTRHPELLNSIAEARTENAQFHTQAAQQGLAGQSTVLNKLDSLQASMTTLGVGVQNIQCRQSSTIESLAQVKVENSTFLAGVTQQIPMTDDPGSFLRHALQPLLEEYSEKIIAGVKKEFRGTARYEMDNMFQRALPALDEMQHRSKATRQDRREVVDEVATKTGPDDFEQRHSPRLEGFELLDKQSHGQFDKDNLTIAYRNFWWAETSIGKLSIFIRHTIRFNAFGIPTEVYQLAAQFNPSPRWLSTGCSIIYENRTDARGNAEFGLRLKSYRVLNPDHKVWDAIRRNDVSSIQRMLLQKTISTSDRDIYGRTLLHRAVVCGYLDVCKALVQSGADINARDSRGSSPIEAATKPSNLCRNGRDIFHYLLGSSGIELDGFWLNGNTIDGMAASIQYMRADSLQQLQTDLQDWVSVCRFLDFDFNIPGERTFLEIVIGFFSILEFRTSRNYRELFDMIVEQRIGCSNSADPYDIPVASVARKIQSNLNNAYKISLISKEVSSTLSVSYRGYYTHPTNAEILNFLEYVISKGIMQRPGCIFDTYRDWSITKWFENPPWEYIWEGILEDNGFDVDWVYEEDARRQRVVTGETTAHEVDVGVDTSKVLEMKRRRGYENSDD
ncbi:hypothetical protein F4781DRAFT_441423 [Annulohypoxylon bovei var. microspora]|nr:hypothetical protein F4781DRAFT_441423 [Annulohypoxylon bovei var. microspora]